MDATRPAPPARRTDESTATEAQDAGAPTAPTAAGRRQGGDGRSDGNRGGFDPGDYGQRPAGAPRIRSRLCPPRRPRPPA